MPANSPSSPSLSTSLRPSDASVAFFNDVVSEYDSLIQRHVPCYAELFWSMFHYLPQGWGPQNILELGCGTGNLTLLLRRHFPDSDIVAVDMAPAMCQATLEKVGAHRLTTVESSFTQLKQPDQSADLIMSSLALHHLLPDEHEAMIGQAFEWLKPGGFLVIADGIRSQSDRLFEIDCALWDQLSLEHGVTPEELKQLVAHREAHDHYATVEGMLGWMRKAGFKQPELLWRYSVWGSFLAQKPTAP